MKKLIICVMFSLLLFTSCSDGLYLADVAELDAKASEEMIENVATPLPTTITLAEDIAITDISGAKYITGTLTNVSDRTLTGVIVTFSLYDENEVITEQVIAYSETLEAGAVFNYQTSVLPPTTKYISLVSVTAY